MRDGTLERIFRKWGVWNDDQPKLYARLLAGEPVAPISGSDAAIGVATLSRWQATARYLPRSFAGVDHDRALVPCDGGRRRAGHAHRERSRLWQRPPTSGRSPATSN